MAEVYIDITDLVDFVSAYGNVTGIQRVQERVLYELAQRQDVDRFWCVTIPEDGHGYRAYRLRDLYAARDSSLFERFGGLAGDQSNGFWPSRKEVKRYLNQRGLHGLRRAACKAGVFARATFAPSTLATQGISQPRIQPADVMPLRFLPAEATLVLLGAGWNDPRVADAAIRHAEIGGCVVQCIHDLIPLKHPEYFHGGPRQSFQAYFDRIVPHVTQFVCISENTRLDLEELLAERGISAPAHVLPLAHEFPGSPRNARGSRPTDERLTAFGSPERRFLLCVGTLEVRKNGIALLKAWQQLKGTLGDATPHLVFSGRRGWKIDPFFTLLNADPWLRSRVKLVSGASDADIAFLHERSLCSIYPSLYEGWGLPVGEAAWFGRTCITSRESSLPEVCGMLVDYVDPRNVAEIAERVRQVVEEPERLAWRESLIRQAALRTWQDVAAEFSAVITGQTAAAADNDVKMPTISSLSLPQAA